MRQLGCLDVIRMAFHAYPAVVLASCFVTYNPSAAPKAEGADVTDRLLTQINGRQLKAGDFLPVRSCSGLSDACPLSVSECHKTCS